MLNPDKPYIIGETAFHHMGELDFQLRLVDDIAALQLDAIKFHLLLDTATYMVPHHEAFANLDKWTFDETQWKQIIHHANAKGLDLVLLCNDVKSIELVNRLQVQVRAIELHATGLNDHFLLEAAATFSSTVILGVGGSTLDEIWYAIDFLRKRGKEDIFLMFGFQNYPTDYKDINLDKMDAIRDLFGLPVGYADHTDPQDVNQALVSVMGVIKGYNVLEKHYTPVPGEERIDAQAAISGEQMQEIKELLEVIRLVKGDGSLKMSQAEQNYGNTGPMKKAIVANRDIKKGEKLSLDNLWFKRTEVSSYIRQNQFTQLLGLETLEDIKENELIDFSKVKYEFKKADNSQFFAGGGKK